MTISTLKLHIGVSRSVWKASIVLANYLEQLPDDFLASKDGLNILELGSGPGLGGIFAASYLKNANVFLTDICTKSLKLIKSNID